MAVGVLLMTHAAVGQALLHAARHVLGTLPLPVECVEVDHGDAPEAALRRASTAVRQLDRGDGVLILTDIFGATPCNVSRRLAATGVVTQRVAGVNLPMLLRTLNYPEQPLPELARTAASGGRNGIFIDAAGGTQNHA